MSFLRDTLYDLTAARFTQMADSKDQEAEGELTLEELERFTAVDLEPMADPMTWHAELTDILTVRGSEYEEALERGADSIMDTLSDLVSRYAIVWAQCKAAELAEPRQRLDDQVKPEDPLAGMEGAVADRIRLLANFPMGDLKGTSKDGKVTVTAVSRRDDLSDSMTLTFGGSNFNARVVKIEPFQGQILKDPEYLRNMIEAVNAATEDCRAMFGTERSLEEMEAEAKAEMARIDKDHPRFWGCHGVGAIFTTLGVMRCELEVLKDPAEEAFTNTADILDLLEQGLAEFAALHRAFKTAQDPSSPQDIPSPQDTLREVAPVRQFFLCSLGSPADFPEKMTGIAQKVYWAIKAEVHRAKSRRVAYRHFVSSWWRSAQKLASLKEEVFEASGKYGCVRVSGAGKLQSLEIAAEMRVSHLLELLNEAFEKCSMEHRQARPSLLMGIDGWSSVKRVFRSSPAKAENTCKNLN